LKTELSALFTLMRGKGETPWGVICLVLGGRRTPERVFTKNLSLTFGSGRYHVDDAIEKSMAGSPTFMSHRRFSWNLEK
jgi:hypothetical protein